MINHSRVFSNIYTGHYLRIVAFIKACSYYIYQSFLWAKCQSRLDWYQTGSLMYWDFCHKTQENWADIDKGKFVMLNLMTRNAILMSFWDISISHSWSNNFVTISLLDIGWYRFYWQPSGVYILTKEFTATQVVICQQSDLFLKVTDPTIIT